MIFDCLSTKNPDTPKRAKALPGSPASELKNPDSLFLGTLCDCLARTPSPNHSAYRMTQFASLITDFGACLPPPGARNAWTALDLKSHGESRPSSRLRTNIAKRRRLLGHACAYTHGMSAEPEGGMGFPDTVWRMLRER